MTDTTKRLIIAAVVAAALIAGSVVAMALMDESDDEPPRPLVALAEGLDDDVQPGDFLTELLDRLGTRSDAPGLAEMLLDFFGTLRDDLMPATPPAPVPDQPDGVPPQDGDRDRRPPQAAPQPSPGDAPDRRPFDGPGGRDAPGPRFDGPFGGLFDDGVIGPGEADVLRRLFGELFGGGFALPGDPFVLPDAPAAPPGDRPGQSPFGDLPLDEFLRDGVITPDEARELERLLRDAVPMFRFEFVPPGDDRAVPPLPDALVEGLADLPFREFFADGELTPEEREVLRRALNEWLDRVFERFDAASG